MITKFEDILTSIDQAVNLKKAGVKQYSLFAWSIDKKKIISPDKKPFFAGKDDISLFTNEELKSLLPLEYDGFNLHINRTNYGIRVMYAKQKNIGDYPTVEYFYQSNSQKENDALVDVLLHFYERKKILPIIVTKAKSKAIFKDWQ